MGTSSSSNGPGPGVPLIPPWAADPPAPPPDPNAPPPDPNAPQDAAPSTPANTPTPPPATPPPLSVPARFAGARTNLNRFAKSGSSDDMRSGLGHYVSKGYGGAATTTARFNGTARTAATLSSALSALTGGGASAATADGRVFDAGKLVGRTADEIIDAVVEAVRPVDGTQDAEASREAIRDAMTEVLDELPDTNMLDLDDPARMLIIERYVAHDVFHRVALDLGKDIQDNAPSAAAGLSRLKEVKDFVRESIASAFRSLAQNGRALSGPNIAQVVREALSETFKIFEGYAT